MELIPQKYVLLIAAVEELIALGHKVDGMAQSANLQAATDPAVAHDTAQGALSELVGAVQTLESVYKRATA